MKDQLYRLASDYLLSEEAKEQRKKFRDKVLFWGGLACLVVLIGIATNAYAAPMAKNQDECLMLGDYGVTTRAMVLAGVDLQKRLATLEAMYVLDERMLELAKIVRLAADKSEHSANDFAGLVLQTCLKTQGDISGLLGPAS
jgi:hypothetical protein